MVTHHTPIHRDEKVSAPRVGAGWLALLAAPGAFGLTAPAIVLPRIAEALDVTLATATWLATTNGLGVAIGAPLAAALVARRGLRATLLMSTVLMAIGTVILGVATDIALALPGRGLQAVGSAGLIAVAMNLAGTPRRMGLITSSLAAVAAIGGLTGSLATEWIGWPVSLMLPALGLLGLVGTLHRAPRTATSSRPVDLVGLALVVALGGALTAVPTAPAPALAAAVVSAGALVLWTRAKPYGFVPHSLLGNSFFTGACALVLALGTGYFALIYLVPHRLLHGSRWSEDGVGIALLVVQLLGAGLALVMASRAHRVAPRHVVILLVGIGAAELLVAFPPLAVTLLLALGLAQVGAAGGQGVLIAFATDSVDERDVPVAIGLFNLCYQLGGAFGPALLPLLSSIST
ncbi:MAG TPA: MFS transporter [Candidatus Avipropionibacterium avicola]|uniref:MFS transporter n=1 Tax=Candidatus Avipropionibacterium avicola TaxID=2840701 RepID=A0A9D1KQ47_9ACTN|nr:MFS transporter [Candidatus Avipropionibacterium avicola]